jgi:hypothetical protein
MELIFLHAKKLAEVAQEQLDSLRTWIHSHTATMVKVLL